MKCLPVGLTSLGRQKQNNQTRKENTQWQSQMQFNADRGSMYTTRRISRFSPNPLAVVLMMAWRVTRAVPSTSKGVTGFTPTTKKDNRQELLRLDEYFRIYHPNPDWVLRQSQRLLAEGRWKSICGQSLRRPLISRLARFCRCHREGIDGKITDLYPNPMVTKG